MQRVRRVLQARSCTVQQQRLVACIDAQRPDAAGSAHSRCSEYAEALQFCQGHVAPLPFSHHSFTGQYMM
jgi:hypothetical protein